MTTNDSEDPIQPRPLAERLLAAAESNPMLRAHLVERWARANVWTVVEGIALAWTLDPSKLGTTELLRKRPETELPEEARHYLDMARRSPACVNGQAKPPRFIAWAESVGIAFHPTWRHAVDHGASDIAQARSIEAASKRQRLIQFWARAAYWTPEEGAALARDLDPKEAIVRSAGGYDRAALRSSDGQHLLDLALRSVEVGALNERATPVEFMTWARTITVEFHTDWWAVVGDTAKRTSDQPVPSRLAADAELKTLEKDSLLKLVIGMAMGGYGWDPKVARNSSTKEIADDLDRHGVSLDPNTIRKWLREGADLLARERD